MSGDFSLDELKKEGQVSHDDEQDVSDVEQKKSLISNVYSTDADDNYKDLSDWEDFDEMAYLVTKQNGLLRDVLKDITPSGTHEEWYCQFQVKLAHYIGDIVGRDLPQNTEAEGPVPLLDFLAIDANDILTYMESDEEIAEEVIQTVAQTEMGQEAVRNELGLDEEEDEEEEETEQEAEEPEAEADDD